MRARDVEQPVLAAAGAVLRNRPARRLGERRAGLRVLYLSGNPDGTPGADELPEGTDFLGKPFRIEDLEEKVRRLLGR